MCYKEAQGHNPKREQLEEVSLKGRNLLISLEKKTSRTGDPEEGQKGQGKQLPTSASANQPANKEGYLKMGDGVGLVKGIRRPDPKLGLAKDPSRDWKGRQSAQVSHQCCSLFWLGGDMNTAAAATSLARS